jgi:hypothetical protein
MGDAAVVAGRLHAVVGAQGVIAHGQIVPGRLVQVAERRRQAVAAMLAGRAAGRPQGVLQTLRQGDIALPTQDHVGMLEARVDQAEVIEPVIERRAGDGDRQARHVGEVRQAHPSRLVRLTEDHVPIGAVQRPPGAYAPLHRPAHPLGQVGVTPPHLLEDGYRSQLRRRLQHRHDLRLEDRRQGIGPSPVPRLGLLGRKPGVFLEAIGRGLAERRLRRRHRRPVRLSMLHVEPHLVIGDMAAGQRRDPPRREGPSVSGRSRSPAAPPSGASAEFFRSRAYGRATPSLRLETRCGSLILIVAPLSS